MKFDKWLDIIAAATPVIFQSDSKTLYTDPAF